MSKYKVGPIRGHHKPRTYSVSAWLRVVGMERVEELRRQGFFPPRQPARESW